MRKAMLLLSLILATTLQAQKARELFKSMPEAMLPTLTPVNKADFVDFIDSKMKAEVKNKLGGTSTMKALTDDYVLIQTSEKSTWQMKVLAAEGGKALICVVSTVYGPVGDSDVRFYNTDWTEITSGKYLPETGNPDAAAGGMQLSEAQLSPDSASITLIHARPEDALLLNDAKPVANPNDTVVYHWAGNGSGFR